MLPLRLPRSTHIDGLQYDDARCCSGQKVTYGGKGVKLSGVIVFPTAIDIEQGPDAEISYPAIKVDEPVTAIPAPGDAVDQPRATDLIQLQVTAEGQMDRLNNLQGKRVTIICSDVFAAIAADQFTPILCSVGTINESERAIGQPGSSAVRHSSLPLVTEEPLRRSVPSDPASALP